MASKSASYEGTSEYIFDAHVPFGLQGFCGVVKELDSYFSEHNVCIGAVVGDVSSRASGVNFLQKIGYFVNRVNNCPKVEIKRFM